MWGYNYGFVTDQSIFCLIVTNPIKGSNKQSIWLLLLSRLPTLAVAHSPKPDFKFSSEFKVYKGIINIWLLQYSITQV